MIKTVTNCHASHAPGFCDIWTFQVFYHVSYSVLRITSHNFFCYRLQSILNRIVSSEKLLLMYFAHRRRISKCCPKHVVYTVSCKKPKIGTFSTTKFGGGMRHPYTLAGVL